MADGETEDPDATGGAPSQSGSRPMFRNSLLWGLVGALSFLVLIQGYELIAGDPVGLGTKFGVAAAVGLGATAATRTLASRVPIENESS